MKKCKPAVAPSMTGSRKTMSLRAKMILSFALFTLIVLTVLWLFQTFWLNDIYRSLKMKDLDTVSSRVTRVVKDGGSDSDIDVITGEMAKKYATCITVYKISSSYGIKTASVVSDRHISSLCFIHNLRDESMLNNLYSLARENGGEYKERLYLSSVFGSVEGEDDTGENVILAKLIGSGNYQYLLIFNTELIPLSATVKTLQVELLWISVILIATSLVLAVVLSNTLSKPLRKMSVEASKLALGDYNVNFDGSNCTETAHLSETLNKAAYELSKLDKMQKDLIANVSHDLRTPLTLISGYTEAMRDLPGEATQENLQIVLDETARLSSLVGDMLEVSRYQNGVGELKLSRFNITETVRKTLTRYAKLVEHDGYKINFVCDIDVYVTADEGRILQVIYNLVNNAVNYTGDDKIVCVRQTVVDSGEKVLIEVTDSGDGIPEESLPLVWERYYKVHDFHKRADVGTGLGLSIVKNVLLLHRAEFGVNSRIGVGSGSCFWFKLPVDKD